MDIMCLHACSQARSLPFLCQSLIFPVLLFQFLLESIEFGPMIASAFSEFLELIGWHVQKLSHNRRTQRNITVFYVHLSPSSQNLFFPRFSLLCLSVIGRLPAFIQNVWTFDSSCGNSRCNHWTVQTCSTAHERGLLCAWDVLDLLCVD